MWRTISSAAVLVVAVLITASSTSDSSIPASALDLRDLPPHYLAPVLVTDCPLHHIPDAESPDGPCVCDVSSCPTPACQAGEVLLVPGRSSACCPAAAYRCVPCSDEELATGACRCSATMTGVDNSSYVDGGACQCLDEGRSWDGAMGCQCDVGKCRLPDLCLGNSVEVRVMEDCCERVTCAECPEDSVAQVLAPDSAIEAKCVCRACPDKVCSENEVTVIRKPGRNVPNLCCDLYDCIEKGCTINGTKYDEGEQWSIEEDTQCRCQNGIALCNRPTQEQKEAELTNCFYSGNSYRDGDVWTVDQCTNCTCHSGQAKCIAHMCMQLNETVVTYPTACPPMCLIGCSNGYVRAVDEQGCLLCKCVKAEVEESRDEHMAVKIVVIVAGILAIFVLTTVTFFILRRKCKRMRYYPETKHNLLLDNNNTFRDIYTSTTKPEDQVTLPLYKATTVENTRN